jgi:rhamnogalacturonan hydrolase
MLTPQVMVTNKDECVTVKSPAHNILVENIYCNWSGGSAFGSLGVNVDISRIHYRNVYTINSNQMMMIKSNGGSGSMHDVLLENFLGHSNAYTLDIDQHWSPMKANGGAGVGLRNITFKVGRSPLSPGTSSPPAQNWKGTCQNGMQRGPIKVVCSDQRPCTGIHIQDFAVWTESGKSVTYTCRSAYGSGGCLKPGSGGAYAEVKRVVSSPPANYKAPTMQWDLRSSPGTNSPIGIPAMPSSFFPGTRPIKPLAGRGRMRSLNETDDELLESFYSYVA